MTAPASSTGPLGAHVSIAGGLPLAFGRALDLGCTAMQIFVKNASQWRGKALLDEECGAFREAHRTSGIGPLLAHSSYLLNLAALDPLVLSKSLAALGDELDRCRRLGISGLVVHPGAHLGAGEEAGLDRIARSLDEVLAPREGSPVAVLLELTAGQGTTLGYRLGHLGEIRRRTAAPAAIGVCVDTCHAVAAGYPLHEAAGYDAFWDELDEQVGIESLRAIHLNDSRHPCGSRKDRHANIGEGHVGVPTFARLLLDPALRRVPKIIETPSPADCSGHRRDLERLRELTAAV